MTLIRGTGSQLHAARVLVGLSREDLAERAGLCRHSIRKWETSSHTMPGAMYSHLIRVVDVLEGQGARFSGDGVYALCGEHHHQTIEVVLAFINFESLWTWLLRSVTPAYATRA
jgi:hypothetical protein